MDEPLVRAFPVTRRSALEAARSADSAERARGLRTVSEAYWRPVYGYLRLHWKKQHEDAADLTQEFFAQLVDKDLLGRFDPAKARLRTFLRVCIDGLVANQARAANRQKRRAHAFDFEAARVALGGREAAASPDAEFEKEWSRAVFAMALERLRDRCQREGKEQHFALLEAYDLGDRPSYAALAERFGIAVTDVTNRLAWSRRELRASVFEVLGELTSSDEELREEARALLEPE
ncbi:MAG: RNA polymerase sigma factor [Myxococcales bacterium]|nr:sigma-70 family RNA polymerase sigma factor [Myxococcales bacterium]